MTDNLTSTKHQLTQWWLFNHKWGLLGFTRLYFYWSCWRCLSLLCVWILQIQDYSRLSQGPMNCYLYLKPRIYIIIIKNINQWGLWRFTWLLFWLTFYKVSILNNWKLIRLKSHMTGVNCYLHLKPHLKATSKYPWYIIGVLPLSLSSISLLYTRDNVQNVIQCLL